MSKENYSRQEETTYHSSVNEPQASYGLSVNDLRTELIREVLHIEDKFLLHEALNYFKNLTLTNTNKQACKAEEQEWWTLISKEERQSIEKGLADIEARRTITHDEMRKHYAKWL